MRTKATLAAATMMVGAWTGPTAAGPAPAAPVARTDLQRHDLDIAGHETVHARIDFPPGSVAPRHTHPGEEIIYVLAGPLQYQIAAGEWRTFNTGDVLFIPTGTVHAARNTGTSAAAELATYVVEKGKPLVVLAH